MLNLKTLHAELDSILAAELDNASLRRALEELRGRAKGSFSLVSYRFARDLLERNDVGLRSFVLGVVEPYALDARGKRVHRWGANEADLTWILRFAEEQNEDDLFRSFFYAVHERDAPKKATKRIAAALATGDASTLGRELERLRYIVRFDDSLAIQLYESFPSLARNAILSGLPFRRYGDRGKSELLPRLLERVRHDEDFFFALYRRTAGEIRWKRDVARLLNESLPAELSIELEKHHLSPAPTSVGTVLAEVLEKRGTDGLPYVRKKLGVHRYGLGDGGFKRLQEAVEAVGDDALSAQLLRSHGRPAEYNAAVLDALNRGNRTRLLLLAGTGGEMNFPGLSFARVPPLEDKVALEMLSRDPELLRGPFRRNLFAGYRETYPRLVKAAIEREDHDLIDFLASRFITRAHTFGGGKAQVSAELISREFESLLERDASLFACRAARVLGQVPPYSIWNYDRLLTTNRLARLLYEFSPAAFLSSEAALVDLLEAPEIHAQRVAFRALSLNDKRSGAFAAQHRRLLGAALLRPLHRRTRAIAFDAIRRGASDRAAAEFFLRQAREAAYLPSRRYPMEELIHLIGDILMMHPELRLEDEKPRVFRERVSRMAR